MRLCDICRSEVYGKCLVLEAYTSRPVQRMHSSGELSFQVILDICDDCQEKIEKKKLVKELREFIATALSRYIMISPPEAEKSAEGRDSKGGSDA